MYFNICNWFLAAVESLTLYPMEKKTKNLESSILEAFAEEN